LFEVVCSVTFPFEEGVLFLAGYVVQKQEVLKVGVAGLGVIGWEVAKALDRGIPGLELHAVAVRDRVKAAKALVELSASPVILDLETLSSEVDVVVECAPSAIFDQIARPAVEKGRILVVMSSAALLSRPDLFRQTEETGARILVPSGGMLGFDAIRAAVEGEIDLIRLITRKPPDSLAGAPYLLEHDIDVSGLRVPKLVFEGSALEAAAAFPANANVAASLSLVCGAPEKVSVEMWADPGITVLSQEVLVESDAAELRMSIKSFPMPDNPRTGSLTPKSAISVLRSLVSGVRIGS